MAVEGVLVSYNYSDDGEHANILTVSASGIRFSPRWVLTHGSILSPLKEAKVFQNSRGKPILNDAFYASLPEIHVACEKRLQSDDVYENVERLSRERDLRAGELEHSSYQIRVLTGRIVHAWQCPILDRCVDDILYSWTIGHRDGDMEKQTRLGKALLSVFILIDLESDNRGLESLRPLSSLLDLVRPPTNRGSSVEVHSTPFGCEAFLNTVTRGTICGVVGKRPSLLLTDTASALGSEGGPVFTDGATPTVSILYEDLLQGSRRDHASPPKDLRALSRQKYKKELIGIVICSVSWWRGEWVGLTLVAPLCSVLAVKLRVASVPVPLHYGEPLESIDKTTVLVRCGNAWGAGVYLGGGFVVTCAHVVTPGVNVSIYCQRVRETAIVRYRSTDEKAYDLALLYMNPERCTHLKPAVLSDTRCEKGESVLAAGYPYFNNDNIEDLMPTVTSGHINNVSPSMIQTSCCVQSGFSGGPIFRMLSSKSVEVVAVTVSNAQAHSGACYPYINMAVPVTVFAQSVRAFMELKDDAKLRSIENRPEMIQAQWRLLPYRSKI